MENQIAETVSIQVSSQDERPFLTAFNSWSNIRLQTSIYNHDGIVAFIVPYIPEKKADIGNKVIFCQIPTQFLDFLKDTGIPFST